MATKLKVLGLYRFLQKNKFSAIEDVKGRLPQGSKEYENSGNFYPDPENFFNTTSLDKQGDEDNRFINLELPAELDFLNTAENEKERNVKLDSLNENELKTTAENLQKYIINYQKYSHFVGRLDDPELNISDSEKNRLKTIYKKNANPAEISALDFDTNETKLQKEIENRNEIEAIYDSLPIVLRKNVESYFTNGKLDKEPKKFVFENALDNNKKPILDENKKPTKQIKKDTSGNSVKESTESTSTDILTHLQEVKSSNAKIIKAVGDKFKGPVGYSASENTRKDDFGIKSQGVNSSIYIIASESMNDGINPVYKDWARRPNWALDEKEKSKFKYKDPKLFQTIMPGQGLDFIVMPLDGILGLGTNLFRRVVTHPISKAVKHKQNETKELIAFAKKYMPELYNDPTQLPKRHRDIMNKHDSSIYWSGLKINRFYQETVRNKYGSIEKTNELYQKLQDQFKDNLESEEAKKAFKTLDYVTNMYLGSKTPWLFQGATHLARRVFGNKKANIQRRIRQATLSGGNYLEHSKKSVEAMEDLFVYFKQSGNPLEGKSGFGKISKAIQKLRDAKKNSGKGNFLELEHDVFEAIQSANLLKNKKVVSEMLNNLKDLKPQAQKENLLRKINFIVGNVSSPRTQWFDFGKRMFPRLELGRKQKNRAEFEAKLNSALIGIDSNDDSEILKYLNDIPNPVDKNGKKIEIPSNLKKAIVSGKLNSSSKGELRSYMKKLRDQNAFETHLNSKAVDTEINEKGRQVIKLDNEKMVMTGLLYSLAFNNQSNVADIIDAKDKAIVEKDINKRINSLHEEAYQGLMNESANEGVEKENASIYVNLKGMEHVLNEVTSKYALAMRDGKGNKEFREKVEKATTLTATIKELKELLVNSGDKFIYQNDPSDNFISRHEEALKDIKALEVDVNYGMAGTVSFKKAMEEKYKPDESKKTAENLKSEIENTEKRMSDAIKEGQKKRMSEFVTVVNKKIKKDNKQNDLSTSRLLLAELEKKRKEINDLLKSTNEQPTAEVKEAKRQIQALKDKVEGKETEKAKEKTEKPIKDLKLKIAELQFSKKTMQKKEDEIQAIKNKATSIIQTYKKKKETTPSGVYDIFTKILEIENGLNQKRIIGKLDDLSKAA